MDKFIRLPLLRSLFFKWLFFKGFLAASINRLPCLLKAQSKCLVVDQLAKDV
jgi:hypothetical protein